MSEGWSSFAAFDTRQPRSSACAVPPRSVLLVVCPWHTRSSYALIQRFITNTPDPRLISKMAVHTISLEVSSLILFLTLSGLFDCL